MTRLSFILIALGGCLGADQLARRQYEADYANAVQQCGHPEAAFQHGYNAGAAGQKMSGDWSALCTPDVRAQSVTAYNDGFLEGAKHQPIRVVHTVAPVRVVSTQASCTFDSDCGGDGFSCRHGVCMGYGSTGDQCVFNSDCLSDHCFGGTCHE